MHDCRAFALALSDYLDGALDAGRRAAIDAHLTCCVRCRLLCQTTRRTVQLYRRLPAAAVPSDVESRLMTALELRMNGK